MATEDIRKALSDSARIIFSYMLTTREEGQDWKITQIEHKMKNTVADPIGVMRHFPMIFHIKESTKSVDLKCPIDLCAQHWSTEGCTGDCGKLHICKFFILGTCKRNAKCKFGHSITGYHNLDLLNSAKLDCYDIDELRYLLSKSLAFKRKSLPNICIHHNRPNGCRKGEGGTGCPYMHICERFLKYDTCQYHSDYCRYSHDIRKPQVKEILYEFGYDIEMRPGTEILGDLRERYKRFSRQPSAGGNYEKMGTRSSSEESLASKTSGESDLIPHMSREQSAKPKGDEAGLRNRSSIDLQPMPGGLSVNKDEICVLNLENKCKYKDKCTKLHTTFPYQWQFYDEGNKRWVPFAENINSDIEKVFCDPVYEVLPLYFGEQVAEIDFKSMTFRAAETKDIRRLSTPSSVEYSTNSHFSSTQWVWYWVNELDVWQEYPNNHKIEETFLKDFDTMSFQAGTHKYILNFKEMYQQNVRYGTKRAVRRRPKAFVPNPPLASEQKNGKEQIFPDDWLCSKVDKPNNCNVKLALLASEHPEYQEVAARFQESMSVPITAVYRIENAELWEEYIRKKQKMIKKKGGQPAATPLKTLVNNRSQSLNELLLFHGTKRDFIEPIFKRDGFDSRDAGKSVGSKWGKGSYFASDAKYSHCYTDCNTLFIARVLVGNPALGNPLYTKPPPVNPNDSHGELHDSCVNDVRHPSIFVTFENRQSYPAYLVQYDSPKPEWDDFDQISKRMSHQNRKWALANKLDELCYSNPVDRNIFLKIEKVKSMWGV